MKTRNVCANAKVFLFRKDFQISKIRGKTLTNSMLSYEATRAKYTNNKVRQVRKTNSTKLTCSGHTKNTRGKMR